MKNFKRITLITLVSLISTSVLAQNFGRARTGEIILYSGVNFTGERKVINRDIANLQSINFDEAAGSLVAYGEWQVCLDPNYGSRCRIYSNEVPNLESFKGRISSVRFMGRGNNYSNNANRRDDYGNNGNYNNHNSRNTPSSVGRSSVFYPGQIGNVRASQSNANDFCREQGQSYAAFYSGDPILEDVLCKR